MKRHGHDAGQNVVMRDVDVNFKTEVIMFPDSGIARVEDLLGKRFTLGRLSSVQVGLLASLCQTDLYSPMPEVIRIV